MHDGKIINVDGVYHWSVVDRIFFRTVFGSIETHAGMRRHTETVMSPPETPVAQALHPDRVGFSSITTSGALRYRFNHRRCPPHTCSTPSLIASLFTSTDLQIWENQGYGASYFLICFHLFTSEFFAGMYCKCRTFLFLTPCSSAPKCSTLYLILYSQLFNCDLRFCSTAEVAISSCGSIGLPPETLAKVFTQHSPLRVLVVRSS